MAKHYYGASIGAGFETSNVSTGTSTTSKDVEIVITDAVTGMSKTEVVKLVEVIVAYILKNNAPA